MYTAIGGCAGYVAVGEDLLFTFVPGQDDVALRGIERGEGNLVGG